MSTTHKKVLFVGPPCSGKSLIMDELLGETIHMDHTYTPTLGVELYPYYAPSGGKYNIWDCGGRHIGLANDYYKQGDIAIVFGDDEDFRYRNALIQTSPRIAIYHVRYPNVDIVRNILV